MFRVGSDIPVSYTHLYFREGQERQATENAGQTKLLAFFQLNRSDPVSYTHLDVYKRQQIFANNHFTRFSVITSLESIRIS